MSGPLRRERVTHKVHIRATVFAGVLIIVSSLMIGLFHQARAVSVLFVDPQTSFAGDSTFTVDVIIPGNQRIPIEFVEAVLEKQASSKVGTSGLAGKGQSFVAERVRCPMVAAIDYNCPDDAALVVLDGSSGLVTRIKFIGAFAGSASDINKILDGYGYYQQGLLSGTRTGYGYDSVSAAYLSQGFGYGYGYETGDASSFDIGVGLGYGYGADQLVLRFTITVSGTAMDTGVRYLTFQLITGSGVIGVLSSPFTEFTVTGGGGATGGGGVETPTGTGSGETQTITASPTTIPQGATAAYLATISTAKAGNTVIINTGDPIFTKITLKIALDISNVQVTIVRWPSTTPPTGTGNVPQGVAVAYFLEIKLSGASGTVSTAIIAISLPEVDVPDSAKGALLHFKNGAWFPEKRVTLALAQGRYTGEVESPCCSAFAMGFDTQAPTVSYTGPTGTLTGTVKLTATATDNLKVALVEFFVDGTKKGDDASEPYEFSLDSATLANGAHTIRVLAHDFVENTKDATESVTVQNESPSPTVTTKTTAAGPGPAAKIPAWVWVLIALVVIGIIIAAVVTSKKKGPPGGKPPPPAKK